jgi:hypothetical protein
MHRQYREKERSYWEAKIASHTKEPKRLWTAFNALLGRRRPERPPDTPFFTADDFLASFEAKILDIRQATADSLPPDYPPSNCHLSTLNSVTSAELRRIILSSPPKSCELDPIPTFLLHEFIDILLPLLTTLCNRSLQEGILPSTQKRSILIPALKSGGLDPTNPGNYRPIANVTFLSKLIEKVVAMQLVAYLEGNKLLPQNQSGFRKFHSTETLLLRLLSDIYGAIDRTQLTLLALFDVSAAFDTVDHEILLERLSVTFGLSGAFYKWIDSFLRERSLCVVHGSSRSSWVPAQYGLPQGSVLGPILYIIYTSGLATLLTAHAVSGQQYADDVQAYAHCLPSNAIEAVRIMSGTLDALETWMSSNRLRLNPSKTKFIWLGTRQQLAKLDLFSLASEFPDFTFATTVHDLGVQLDQELTFAPQLHRLARDCYYQLRQLRTVIRSLTSAATLTLVHSFVTSRIDYCSSLYIGLPSSKLTCLDRVLRSAARLIGKIPKYGHVSNYMLDVLHWLPIRQRIEFRVSALVWRCCQGLAPIYLRELCSLTLGIQGRRQLRSADKGVLLVPFARTATMKNRAFSVVGPVVWNSLPFELRLHPGTLPGSFLTKLKTVLFGRAGVGSASE